MACNRHRYALFEKEHLPKSYQNHNNKGNNPPLCVIFRFFNFGSHFFNFSLNLLNLGGSR